MGRKTERYIRKLKRNKKRIEEMEKTLGINQPPKKCPMCGTLMELRIIQEKRIGGVWAEGDKGYLNMVDPSSMSLSNAAKGVPMYICPNCEYRVANQ